MIRTYDNTDLGPTYSDVATENPMAECPDCCGNGEVFVQRLFGRTAPEPYLTRPCSACGGSGQVDAEAVVFCDGCKGVFWADDVCTHHGVPLCDGCQPYRVCRDCVDERRERAGEYR